MRSWICSSSSVTRRFLSIGQASRWPVKPLCQYSVSNDSFLFERDGVVIPTRSHATNCQHVGAGLEAGEVEFGVQNHNVVPQISLTYGRHQDFLRRLYQFNLIIAFLTPD